MTGLVTAMESWTRLPEFPPNIHPSRGLVRIFHCVEE